MYFLFVKDKIYSYLDYNIIWKHRLILQLLLYFSDIYHVLSVQFKFQIGWSETPVST